MKAADAPQEEAPKDGEAQQKDAKPKDGKDDTSPKDDVAQHAAESGETPREEEEITAPPIVFTQDPVDRYVQQYEKDRSIPVNVFRERLRAYVWHKERTRQTKLLKRDGDYAQTKASEYTQPFIVRFDVAIAALG